MKSLERVTATIRRKKTDRVVWTFNTGAIDGITGVLLDRFEKEYGIRDVAEFLDYDIRNFNVHSKKSDFDEEKYLGKIPESAVLDDWGIAHVKDSSGHEIEMIHPLADSTVKMIEEFPAPVIQDIENGALQNLKNRGYAVAGYAGSLYEWSWWLRGMDVFMMDLVSDENKAAAVIEKVFFYTKQLSAKLAGLGVDILCFYDDVGMQDRMQIRPEIWRKYFKPKWAEIIKNCRRINPECFCFIHTCGDVSGIIPDIIETGFDILNPVQPETMDPEEVKRRYGDRICVWGTISNQRTMPFGSTEDVKKEIESRIRTLGGNGGFILSPSNILEPDTPWENIKTFYETCRKYGG